MALVWNILSVILTITVNSILVFPVLVLFYEVFTIYFPIEEMLIIQSWIQQSMAFLGFPQGMESLCFSISVMIICCLATAIFPYCPILKSLLHLIHGQKTPNAQEQQIIDDALSLLYDHGLEKGKYTFFVARCEFINAFASGAKEITITSMMLSQFPPRLIAGVIAHEIGHHKHGDILFGNILAGLYLIHQLCFRTVQLISFICIYILRFIPFIGIVTMLFGAFLNFILLIYLIITNWPVYIIQMFFCRRSEYAADDYAFELGVAKELRDGMVLMSQHAADGPWWKVPMNDHPRSKSRIKRIEKKLNKIEKNEWNQVYGLSWRQYLSQSPSFSYLFRDKNRLY